MNLLQNDSDCLTDSYHKSGNIDLSRFFICRCIEAIFLPHYRVSLQTAFQNSDFTTKNEKKMLFNVETHSDSFPGGACVDARNL